MANGAEPSQFLSFSRDTFAKLTPGPFLLAHLKEKNAIRPNGRQPDDFRRPTINTGSLSHSNGSAVVRIGDTAVVCGVRGEILLASDIPHPPDEDLSDENVIEELGLLVPNLELSTGCSPTHLPGNPPSSLAQSLSYRLSAAIHDSNMVDSACLEIKYAEPRTEDDLPNAEPTVVVKAYWTLYIDVLCLALDGNAFDAAWLALSAALRDTKLPGAWWDPDKEAILCSPLVTDSHELVLAQIPSASTFAVFTTASPLKPRDEAQSWVLADPDAFEEDVSDESLTVMIRPTTNGGPVLLKTEKSGGSFVSREAMRQCVMQARKRSDQLQTDVPSR